MKSKPYSQGQVANAQCLWPNPSLVPPGYQAFLSGGDKRVGFFWGTAFLPGPVQPFCGCRRSAAYPGKRQVWFFMPGKDRKRLDAIRHRQYRPLSEGLCDDTAQAQTEMGTMNAKQGWMDSPIPRALVEDLGLKQGEGFMVRKSKSGLTLSKK